MAANTQPIFIKKPIVLTCELSNQTVPGPRVGSSVPQLLGKGGENGSLIEEIRISRSGDHPNTAIYLFLKSDESSDYVVWTRLLMEDPGSFDPEDNVYSTPVSVPLHKLLSPASCDGTSPHLGLRIPPGFGLYAGVTVATSNPFILIAMGGDY